MKHRSHPSPIKHNSFIWKIIWRGKSSRNYFLEMPRSHPKMLKFENCTRKTELCIGAQYQFVLLHGLECSLFFVKRSDLKRTSKWVIQLGGGGGGEGVWRANPKKNSLNWTFSKLWYCCSGAWRLISRAVTVKTSGDSKRKLRLRLQKQQYFYETRLFCSSIFFDKRIWLYFIWN